MVVGIIMGGVSSERDISLKTGYEILEKIDNTKYEVKPIVIDDTKNIFEKVKGIDFAFNSLYGEFGEDGSVQAILESLGVPYSGSGILTSSICMNKNLTKIILEKNNIKTARWTIAKNADKIDYFEIEDIGYPVVVKPNNGGSSIAIYLAHNKDEVKHAIDNVLRVDKCAIIEEYLSGEEYSIFMLNGEVYPIVKITTKSKLLDFEAKYLSKDTRKHITYEKDSLLKDIAIKCWDILECEVYSRIDVKVSSGVPYILELNTLPCIRKDGIVDLSIKERGMTTTDLIDIIIEKSLKKDVI